MSPLRAVRPFGLLWLLILLALPGDGQAQPKAVTGFPTPLLTVLNPAGGKAGTSVEMALTGQNLAKPQTLLIDGKPVAVEWLPVPAVDPKKAGTTMQQPKTPGTQTVIAKLQIPTNLSVGLHDLRIVGHWGVSNPRLFAVGDQIEEQEKEPNNDVDQAQIVPLGSTINGVISQSTDVDYFRFEGKKGQRVLLTCLASSIDSRLTPSIQLYSLAGSPLGFARDYRGSDAVLDATLPADGAYLVRVFAFTYTGGSPEHFYRLTISTAPWIDAVVPPMVEPGKTTSVTVYGRNLPGGKLDPTTLLDGRPLETLTMPVTAPADPAIRQKLDIADQIPPHMAAVDGFPLQLKNAAGLSNPYLMQYASHPVTIEQGDNDRVESAQVVKVPCEIAGRIEKIRDRDWFRFSAKKGEVLSIEFTGDRLGSPIDLYAILRPAEGKGGLIELDDNPDLIHPLTMYSRTEDPARYRLVPPADGDYVLLVSSREADIQAGPRSLYRVRIAPEQPDFRVVLQSPALNSPDEPALRAGAAVAFNLFVVPRDGFNAPITLAATGLPAGVSLATTSLPAGTKSATVALLATPEAKEWAGSFTLLAKATIDGKEVVREVRAATIVWALPQNQNVPTISRLARDMVLSVREAPPFKVQIPTTRVVLLPGDSAELLVKVVKLDEAFSGSVAIGPLIPVGNQNNVPFLFNGNADLTLNPGAEGKPKVTAGPNAVPGLYTLQLRGTATMSIVINPETGEKGRGAIPIPAVPVQVLVLPKQVVTPKIADANNVRLKLGEKTDLVVKLDRSPLFTGPVEVELVIPADVRGITSSKTTIAADRDETTLSLLTAAGTMPGPRNNLVVRLSAELEGKKFTQEVKLTVNVLK